MAGRPKRRFSAEEVKEIERMALMNCNTNTIATVLDIPFKTLERHYAKKLRKCRALWKVNLRESQDKLKNISADMAKFLGKNALNQVDKQVIETKVEPVTVPEGQKAAYKAAAKTLRFKLAREGA